MSNAIEDIYRYIKETSQNTEIKSEEVLSSYIISNENILDNCQITVTTIN